MSLFPHTSIDPIIIGSQILAKIQTIISRKMDPMHAGVISNTVFQAGSPNALNVIPDTAFLAGAAHVNDKGDRLMIAEEIDRVAKATCDAYGVTYKLDYLYGYSAVYNNEATTQIVQDIAEELFPERSRTCRRCSAARISPHFPTSCRPPIFGSAPETPKKATTTRITIRSSRWMRRVFLIGVKMFVAVAMNYSALAG